jgi:erythromycin esterase-like protein
MQRRECHLLDHVAYLQCLGSDAVLTDVPQWLITVIRLFVLQFPMMQRAVGNVYREKEERHTHYFDASLPSEFDMVVHIDRTTAPRAC